MNRTIIRLFGFCISIIGVGVWATRINAKPNDSRCHLLSEGDDYGVHYGYYRCRNILTGYLSTDIDFVRQFFDCDHAVDVIPFYGCPGGYCDSTGIYCPEPTFFIETGCSSYGTWCDYSTGQIGTIMPEEGYYFDFCLGDVDYVVTDDNGNPIAPFVAAADSFYLSELSLNCRPCSGMRFVDGKFETYSNSVGNTGSINDIYWTANDGVGITSCRAYSNKSVTSKEGTFTITSEGCPYVE